MYTLTLSSARPPALARALTASSSDVNCVPSSVKVNPEADSSWLTSVLLVYDAIATVAYGNWDSLEETVRGSGNGHLLDQIYNLDHICTLSG